jgi:ankyrin repeat protein
MLKILLSQETLELASDEWNTSPLEIALFSRSFQVCRMLLHDPRAIALLNITPFILHRAVERNCPEIVALLLRHSAVDRNEDDEDVSFLHLALLLCLGDTTSTRNSSGL